MSPIPESPLLTLVARVEFFRPLSAEEPTGPAQALGPLRIATDETLVRHGDVRLPYAPRGFFTGQKRD